VKGVRKPDVYYIERKKAGVGRVHPVIREMSTGRTIKAATVENAIPLERK